MKSNAVEYIKTRKFWGPILGATLSLLFLVISNEVSPEMSSAVRDTITLAFPTIGVGAGFADMKLDHTEAAKAQAVG